MWVGVTLAILVELVPTSSRASMLAAYLFIISNIGGNMNIIVPKLKSLFTGSPRLKYPLLILFPGLYLLSGLLFLLDIVVVRYEAKQRGQTAVIPEPIQYNYRTFSSEAEPDCPSDEEVNL